MANYSRTHMADAVRTKGIKYAGVSVINVVVGQGLLLLFIHVVGLAPGWANFWAVGISAFPAYLLNRAWVWGKKGKNHFRKEVLPFWAMAFVGWIFSTFMVTATADIDFPFIANIVNLGSFGILWVLKFFILDALMFGSHHHIPEPAPGDANL